METISSADLLGMRSHAKEAENYVLACNAYIDRLTRAYLVAQIENGKMRALLNGLPGGQYALEQLDARPRNE